ncbi:MAG: Hpt domain-containing protein [Syntrophobacteraceae bacterium]|jgi:HPt (histidine-containing phosphotransfer) domain-containing protein|nr:Hpt domain-containing protein [Syntrophobacteraceae bacterium]
MNLGHHHGGDSGDRSSDDPVLLDFSKLNSISSLDPQGATGLLKKIIELFMEKSPELILRITAALEAGDAEVVFRAAHSLKSSSATVGAMELSETCRQLETVGRQGSLHGARELSERMQAEFRQVCIALARMTEGL